MPSATIGRSIDEGLVLHLPLNEGTGTKVFDRCSQQNVGTLLNGVSWATGKDDIGKCVSFDGDNDEISIASNANLRVGNEGSISVIANLTALQDSYHIIYTSTGAGDADKAPWLHLASGGRLDAKIGNGATSMSVTSNIICSVGTWYRISMRWNGSTVWLHANNKTWSQEQTVVNALTGDFAIGMASYWCDRRWNGLLQDLRVYNRTITEQEVRELYDMRRRI